MRRDETVRDVSRLNNMTHISVMCVCCRGPGQSSGRCKPPAVGLKERSADQSSVSEEGRIMVRDRQQLHSVSKFSTMFTLCVGIGCRCPSWSEDEQISVRSVNNELHFYENNDFSKKPYFSVSLTSWSG